ncbi:CynX/NimT family MFS transporter [Allofournierella sp.]|uniref:MFS transporter n=1 Tax=Allofournierella sp. TaxID=1940256 RepID=UPI003AB36B2E
MPFKKNSLSLLTALILSGTLFLYVAQMSPSAVLTLLEQEYRIDPAASSFGISVVFLPIILFSLGGSYLLARVGLKKTYALALLLGGLGIVLNLFAENFLLFCIGRIVYGAGFGLSTPFIGAAIMRWYSPPQRVKMDTANALLPYLGNILVFALTLPLTAAFAGSWKAALSVWGFFSLAVLALWLPLAREEGPLAASAPGTVCPAEKGIYRGLVRRREIRLLLIAFVCDFISFSVVTSLLPTYFQRDWGMAIQAANRITTLFPVAGVAGGIAAYHVMARTGRRRTLLWLGQALKAAGIALIYFGGAGAPGLAGVVLVGVGNCIWIPPMFVVPMELEGMTPARVGAAFSLITSCGFAGGLAAPILAGSLSARTSYGFAIFLCIAPCLAGLLAALAIRETGPGAARHNASKL